MITTSSSSGYSPAVQRHLNDLMELALERAKKVAEGKIDEMDKMSLVQVLKEIRMLIRDTKGPNTSITAIQVPSVPQVAPKAQDHRYESINASVEDPEAIEQLRKSQENFLEKGKE